MYFSIDRSQDDNLCVVLKSDFPQNTLLGHGGNLGRQTCCVAPPPAPHGFRNDAGHDAFLCFLHIYPLFGPGGFQDGIANVLRAERMPEIGIAFGRGWIIERFKKLGELVDERMFIS
jgi:hypothetical protein